MTPLTEAELLQMREVQALLPVHPPESDWTFTVVQMWPFKFQVEFIHSGGMQPGDFSSWAEAARTDWPRLTEWALEARRLLEEYATGTISDAEMVPQVRRLLGGE